MAPHNTLALLCQYASRPHWPHTLRTTLRLQTAQCPHAHQPKHNQAVVSVLSTCNMLLLLLLLWCHRPFLSLCRAQLRPSVLLRLTRCSCLLQWQPSRAMRPRYRPAGPAAGQMRLGEQTWTHIAGHTRWVDGSVRELVGCCAHQLVQLQAKRDWCSRPGRISLGAQGWLVVCRCSAWHGTASALSAGDCASAMLLSVRLLLFNVTITCIL
jgi:hypothetical protein